MSFEPLAQEEMPVSEEQNKNSNNNSNSILTLDNINSSDSSTLLCTLTFIHGRNNVHRTNRSIATHSVPN